MTDPTPPEAPARAADAGDLPVGHPDARATSAGSPVGEPGDGTVVAPCRGDTSRGAAHCTGAPPSEVRISLPWMDGAQSRLLYQDAELHSIFARASTYVRAGVAVQFKGPSGMGKTVMALRVAESLGRDIAFVTGHSMMTSEDLIGRQSGESSTRLEDKYISSVRRTETRTWPGWQDGALLSAMRMGHTLVYDEFTRAPAEANVALLSVLEEGILAISHPTEGRKIVRAHPEFSIILISNPADYQGTREAPDALIDRVVTFDFSELPAETESRIVASSTGVSPESAALIVALIRGLRADEAGAMGVSMRTAILIGKLISAQAIPADPGDARFIQVCADALRGRVARTDTETLVRDRLRELERLSSVSPFAVASA